MNPKVKPAEADINISDIPEIREITSFVPIVKGTAYGLLIGAAMGLFIGWLIWK